MKIKITYVKPCITKKNRLAAEMKIDSKINIQEAYKNLRKSFAEIKYSKSLGAVKVSSGGGIALIFGTGEILIRRVKNEKEITELAKKITGALK